MDAGLAARVPTNLGKSRRRSSRSCRQPAGLKCLSKVRPETVQTSIRHLQNPADVARALSVQEKGALGRIHVARLWTITLTLEKLESHQRVREVWYGARTERSAMAISVRFNGCLASFVKRSSSTAESSVFDAKNPIPDLHDI